MIIKVVGIFLIGFLILAIVPVGSAPIQNGDESTDDYLENLYAVMSNPIQIKFPKELEDHEVITCIDTPSEFSWKNYNGIDLTTPARNQGPCGSCWVFAALGAMESLINIKEGFTDIDIDLSEQYVLSCIPAAGSCSGGRTASPFSFIINHTGDNDFLNGVIFEECLPYEADDSIPCSQKAEYWRDTLVPFSGYGEIWFGPNNNSAVDIMKSNIYENGPIYVLMTVDNPFRYFGGLYHRSTDYFHYKSLNVDYLNHAVLVVGWKDDSAVEKGGYWICKNSWGTDWGYDGFFNIEYGSLNIQNYMAWVEYDPDSFKCPLIADAGGICQGTVGEHLIFDGSKSVDAEGRTLQYLWDFGDGTTNEGPIVSHSFPKPGIYAIVLTVTDSQNHSSNDTTIACIDTDVLSFNFSGGYGLTITIENLLDCPLPDATLSVKILGLYQNIDYQYKQIPCIPSHEAYSMILPLMGVGKGTIHFTYNAISVSRPFFSLGLLIFIR